MTNFHKKVILVILLAALAVVTLVMTDFGNRLSLSFVQRAAFDLKAQVDSHYVPSVLIFVGVFIFSNMVIPTAAVLNMLAGFLYGTVLGVIYADIATTAGALLGFWVSRTFVGRWAQKKWARQLRYFNKELAQHGYIYLLGVRMVPIAPYMLINVLVGLTRIRAWTLLWTTAIGSLPCIFVWSYAGRQFLSIESIEDVFTPQVIFAFILLAVFVVAVLIFRVKITRSMKFLNGAENS